MNKFNILFFFIVWISTFGLTEEKYVDEHLITHTDWEFLTRFCWLSLKGTLDYYFEIPAEYAGLKILLYYDTADQWPSVYKKDKTCQEKVSVLSVENHQIIDLKVTNALSGCKAVTRGKKDVYECRGSRYFRSMRERWWYIAASRCGKDDPKGLDLKYKVWMKNGEDGDMLFEEFSADEFYILPIDIAFLLVYAILVGIAIVCAVKLAARQLFHPTYKIFMVSLFLWAFYLFLMSIKYGMYSEDGIERRGLKVMGHVVSAISDIFFIIMLLLMATGYTITRGRLRHLEKALLIGFVSLYSVLYTCIFIWEQVYFDPGLVLYLYESPPGFCLITIRLIGWIWFFVSVVVTLKRFPGKGSFYCPFVIFYTLWFWIVPMMVLIAKFAIPQYMREKIIVGIENSVVLLGHLFFLFLTVPQRANLNFPFHVRTTQVRTDGGSDNDLNYFDENAYQASSEQELTRNDVVFDMFVVTCRHVNSTQAPASALKNVPAYVPGPTHVPSLYGESLPPPSYLQATSLFQVGGDKKESENTNQASGFHSDASQTVEKAIIDKQVETKDVPENADTTNEMAEAAMFSTIPSVLNALPPLEHRDPFVTAHKGNLPPLNTTDDVPQPERRKKKKKKKRARPSAPPADESEIAPPADESGL